MKTKNEKRTNVIVSLIEFILLALYLLLGGESIMKNAARGDLGGMFDDFFGALFLVSVAILLLAILCLTVGSMRTRYTVRMSLWNIIWSFGNFYFLFG